jgi:hypothetical protein
VQTQEYKAKLCPLNKASLCTPGKASLCTPGKASLCTPGKVSKPHSQGVYQSAFVKCFASKLRAKRQAFEVLWDLMSTWGLSTSLTWLLKLLWRDWFTSPEGGNMKDEALEPINFAELHPDWKRLYLSTLPKLPLAEVLAYFKPEDVLAQFKPKDLLAQFKSKGFLSQLKPEDLLAHIKPEDIEIYENYLARLKQSPRATTAKAKARTRKKG